MNYFWHGLFQFLAFTNFMLSAYAAYKSNYEAAAYCIGMAVFFKALIIEDRLK